MKSSKNVVVSDVFENQHNDVVQYCGYYDDGFMLLFAASAVV